VSKRAYGLAVVAAAAALYFGLSFTPPLARLFAAADPTHLLTPPGAVVAPPSWVARFATLGVALAAAALLAAPLGGVILRAVRWARRELGDWGIVVALGGASALASAAFGHFVLGPGGRSWEERELYFQARLFAAGRLTATLPTNELIPTPDMARYFVVGEHEAVRGAKWFTPFEPVWAAALAAGTALKKPALVNPLLGFITAFVLFGYGRRVFGADAALAAVLLYALSPLVAFTAASAFPEPLWLLLLLLFLWLWDVGVTGGRKVAYAAAAFCLALACGTSRELATLAFILPLAAWPAYEAARRGKMDPAIYPLALGFACGLVPLLVYNAATSGAALSFPWLHDWKWYFGFDAPFRPADLALVAVRRLWALATDVQGWPLFSLALALVPLVATRLPRAARHLYLGALGTVVLLALPHAAGTAYGARAYYGVLPAAFLLGGWGLTLLGGLVGPGGKPWRNVVTAAVAFATLGLTVPYVATLAPRYAAYWDTPDGRQPWLTPQLKKALADYDVWDGIVFVAPPARCTGPPPNDLAPTGSVIFARDRGDADVGFATLFSPRTYLRCDYDRFERTGELDVLNLRPVDAARVRKVRRPPGW
jgi:hypothetical protein